MRSINYFVEIWSFRYLLVSSLGEEWGISLIINLNCKRLRVDDKKKKHSGLGERKDSIIDFCVVLKGF
jgi:hypothetical protein